MQEQLVDDHLSGMASIQTRNRDPQPLDQAARARVAQALAASRSANTRMTYAIQWRLWSAWATAAGHAPLPANPLALAAYLTERGDAGAKIATIRTANAAIAAAHRAAGAESPTQDEGVRAVLSGLARIDRRFQRQAKGLSREDLAAIKATAERARGGAGGHRESAATARRRGRVDVALASIMRDGLLRRSEAAALTWGDIEVDDGSGQLHIRHSKTDQEGAGATLYLSPQTMEALLRIRPALLDEQTSVFGLSASQINRRVGAMAEAAGLSGAYSSHSPRVGMAQDLAAFGVELPSLMQAGRWEDPKMPARYTRSQAAGRGAVARYYASVT